MKPDISTSEDIRTLIDAFYEKVKDDDVIGFIFNDIAKVDWPKHLPRMYAFWEFLLLGQDTYKGNPMEVHQKLHNNLKLTDAHFTRWLQLFHATVDEHLQDWSQKTQRTDQPDRNDVEAEICSMM